jgi:PadR family transcriptional regulator AphA
MKENTTKFVLLGLLSRRPLTGYDIKKTVETRLDYIWDLSNGQIYPTLRTLEKNHLITKKIENRENGPTRKIYTITDEGKKELCKWLTIPPRPEINRYEMLLKLIFGDQASKETNTKHIQEFRARNTKLLEVMKQFGKNLDSLPEQTEEAFYVRLTVLLGKKISSASIEWAEIALQLLQERNKAGEMR